MFTGWLILRGQQTLGKVGDTFRGRCPYAHARWKVLQTVVGRQSSSQSHMPPLLPLHDFLQSRKNKKERKKTKKTKKNTPHTVLPPSGGFRPASTRFWCAPDWQPQRLIFLFLCCCFKSQARMVIWKHKNTDMHTVLGKSIIGAKAFRWGTLPAFITESMVPGAAGGHRGNAAGSLPPCTPAVRGSASVPRTGAEKCSHWSQAGATWGRQVTAAKQRGADVQNHMSVS